MNVSPGTIETEIRRSLDTPPWEATWMESNHGEELALRRPTIKPTSCTVWIQFGLEVM